MYQPLDNSLLSLNPLSTLDWIGQNSTSIFTQFHMINFQSILAIWDLTLIVRKKADYIFKWIHKNMWQVLTEIQNGRFTIFLVTGHTGSSKSKEKNKTNIQDKCNTLQTKKSKSGWGTYMQRGCLIQTVLNQSWIHLHIDLQNITLKNTKEKWA